MSSREHVWLVTGARRGLDGKQPGDPAKRANALVQLAGRDEPPTRFVAGTDAMQPAAAKVHALLARIDAHRELSASLVADLPGD